MEQLEKVLGYENERTVIHNNDHQICSKDDTQSVSNILSNDSIEDKTDRNSQRDCEDLDQRRAKNDSNEESLDTEEVVTYTDSSAFLKVINFCLIEKI